MEGGGWQENCIAFFNTVLPLFPTIIITQQWTDHQHIISRQYLNDSIIHGLFHEVQMNFNL